MLTRNRRLPTRGSKTSLPDKGFKDFTSVNVRFVEIVRLGDRLYFAFIERKDSLPLQPDDHFRLCVDTDTAVGDWDWHGNLWLGLSDTAQHAFHFFHFFFVFFYFYYSSTYLQTRHFGRYASILTPLSATGCL